MIDSRTAPSNGAAAAPALTAAPSHRRRVFAVLQFFQVRLRLVAVFLAIFLIVGLWDTARNYWEKLVRTRERDGETVSHAIEYWCPMCPGVASDWPGKCPVCNMALVQRKRGEAVPLPDGVLARMQLSPYRVQLAGIQVSAVGYRPLVREVTAAGFVDCDERSVAHLTSPSDGVIEQVRAPAGTALERSDVLLTLRNSAPLASVNKTRAELLRKFQEAGMRAEDIVFAEADGSAGFRVSPRSSVSGQVLAMHVKAGQSVTAGKPLCEIADLAQVCVKTEVFDKDLPFLKAGQKAELTADALPGHAPWSGKVRLVTTQLLDGAPRLQAWLDINNSDKSLRPGMFVMARLQMPISAVEPFCSLPMSQPPARSEDSRPDCCSPGNVLAVPESAVLDSGIRRIVYLERMTGMFDGIEVVLGPRCRGFYPVVRGLEAGQRVATAGAFLIDAETRLNPSVAAGYFGAAQGSASTPREPAPVKAPETPSMPQALRELSPNDLARARAQEVCPVTGKVLGSMGKPPRVVVDGRIVFLCCAGCEAKLREKSAFYLAKLKGR